VSSALEQLLPTEGGVGLCWLGNLGWLARSRDRLLAFDLDLDCNPRLSPSPVTALELTQGRELRGLE